MELIEIPNSRSDVEGELCEMPFVYTMHAGKLEGVGLVNIEKANFRLSPVYKASTPKTKMRAMDGVLRFLEV